MWWCCSVRRSRRLPTPLPAPLSGSTATVSHRSSSRPPLLPDSRINRQGAIPPWGELVAPSLGQGDSARGFEPAAEESGFFEISAQSCTRGDKPSFPSFAAAACSANVWSSSSSHGSKAAPRRRWHVHPRAHARRDQSTTVVHPRQNQGAQALAPLPSHRCPRASTANMDCLFRWHPAPRRR